VCTYASQFETGHIRDEVWRPVIDGCVGDGLSLWPGQSTELVADVPPHSALRLSTYARAFQTGGDGQEMHFVVRMDDRILLDHRQGASSDDPPDAHLLELPPEGREGARLSFELSGPPALAAFFDPVIGPLEIGGPDARPWGRTRPDIILFLADTFRADCMGLYGGEERHTPQLDAFAMRSLRFLRARSTAAWTLPAQASMLTGLHPPQHGATHTTLRLPEDFTTIAEHLARNGYRTGAVTDSGLVSRTFGFDQGFEWFDESLDWDLRRTFRNATHFLKRDDGRPVFLFVQTFRTHSPYRHGEEEDETLWKAFTAKLIERDATPRQKLALDEVDPELAREMREIYMGGVADLDRGFGSWVRALEQDGLLDNGYLIFTSDHGDAFWEHGEAQHGGKLWEEKIRIPLLLYGHDLEPAAVDWQASLLDLPRTIASLARIPPLESWGGRSLLTLDEERAAFAFSQESEGGEQLVIVHGAQKIFGPTEADALREGRIDAAFDLSADPGEQSDLSGGAQAWARELSRRHAAEAEEALTPQGERHFIDVGGELERRLRKLGYIDD
jgi:arylsulfatase